MMGKIKSSISHCRRVTRSSKGSHGKNVSFHEEEEDIEEGVEESNERSPLRISSICPVAITISSHIIHLCEVWVHEHWSTPSSPILRTLPNPGILAHCPSFLRFYAALEKEGINLAHGDGYLFGWHGTSEVNVPLICHHGFDVELRRGQQYGPGEYFGWCNGTSMGYCRDGNLLLVCMILKGKWTTQQPGTAIIVRNPQSAENLSYCLPLMVINFGKLREVEFMSGSSNNLRHDKINAYNRSRL